MGKNPTGALECVIPPKASAPDKWRLGAAGNLSAALISIMNLVFAYGGQFAFVEVITSMQRPAEFPAAVGVSTLIMGAGYIALGLVGCVSFFCTASSLLLFHVFSVSSRFASP